MKKWIPSKVFNKAHFRYDEKKKVSERNTEIKNKEISQKQNHQESKKIQKWIPPQIEETYRKPSVISTTQPLQSSTPLKFQKSDMDQLKHYLNMMVLNSLTEAVNLLRNWYWDKKSDSRRKIYILLHSFEKNTLIKIFELMTPLERRQMMEIYKSRLNIVSSEIIQVRGSFIDKLSSMEV